MVSDSFRLESTWHCVDSEARLRHGYYNIPTAGAGTVQTDHHKVELLGSSEYAS